MENYYQPLVPNQFYHIFNRGNNRENLFYNDRNFEHFLQKYENYMFPILETYAYCLLPNHFHLAVRVRTKPEIATILANDSTTNSWSRVPFPTPQQLEEYSECALATELFKRFFMSYAKSINLQENRVGSLFQKNFKRLHINSHSYLTTLICYIHTNPQLHQLCTRFEDWPYSSYQSVFSPLPNNLPLPDAQLLPLFENNTELYEQTHQQYLAAKTWDNFRIEN